MTPLRWTGCMGGMLLGYMAGGPMGGFAGLILGWWLCRPRQARKQRPRRRPETIAAPDAALRRAFKTLGLKPDASEDQVRTAYRRLMSLRHPDKLAANGATEVELRAAQQNAHETRKAYETIRERGKKATS